MGIRKSKMTIGEIHALIGSITEIDLEGIEEVAIIVRHDCDNCGLPHQVTSLTTADTQYEFLRLIRRAVD